MSDETTAGTAGDWDEIEQYKAPEDHVPAEMDPQAGKGTQVSEDIEHVGEHRVNPLAGS